MDRIDMSGWYDARLINENTDRRNRYEKKLVKNQNIDRIDMSG